MTGISYMYLKFIKPWMQPELNEAKPELNALACCLWSADGMPRERRGSDPISTAFGADA